jgi:hypothetical protein
MYSKTSLIRTKWGRGGGGRTNSVQISGSPTDTSATDKYVQGNYNMDNTCIYKQCNFNAQKKCPDYLKFGISDFRIIYFMCNLLDLLCGLVVRGPDC